MTLYLSSATTATPTGVVALVSAPSLATHFCWPAEPSAGRAGGRRRSHCRLSKLSTWPPPRPSRRLSGGGPSSPTVRGQRPSHAARETNDNYAVTTKRTESNHSEKTQRTKECENDMLRHVVTQGEIMRQRGEKARGKDRGNSPVWFPLSAVPSQQGWPLHPSTRVCRCRGV